MLQLVHCSRILRLDRRSPLTIALKICARACISSWSARTRRLSVPVVPLQALGGRIFTAMIGTCGDRRRAVGLRVEGVGFDASDSIVPIVDSSLAKGAPKRGGLRSPRKPEMTRSL